MIRDLVAEELRERRRSLAWWSLGVTGFILLNVLFYPSIKDSSELSD